jgi:hypothetical protein
MAAERSLSPELIRQLLDYDPETGAFTWLRRPERAGWDKTFNTRFAGKPALEGIGAHGYRVGAVKVVNVYAHRVAWAWMMGEWPDGEIDHIDGNRTNNAFANLRLTSRGGNAKNLGDRLSKVSGLPKGVFKTHRSKGNPYRAQIAVGRKSIHLGCFPDAESASRAYRDAAVRYGFSDRHASLPPLIYN